MPAVVVDTAAVVAAADTGRPDLQAPASRSIEQQAAEHNSSAAFLCPKKLRDASRKILDVRAATLRARQFTAAKFCSRAPHNFLRQPPSI
jgi:hypothetical protein